MLCKSVNGYYKASVLVEHVMYPTKNNKNKKTHTLGLIYLFLSSGIKYSAINFLYQFCSPVTYQVMPKNLFDSVHIGVSN